MPHPDHLDLNASPAYLSIGSNVGDRESAVLRVTRLIEEMGVGRDLRMSSLYETEPVDCPPMDDFVNAVLEFEPLFGPEDLLGRLQSLERLMGRQSRHNEPRVVDIDIISMGQVLIRTRFLSIPHEQYQNRRFVLVPLREIAPEYRCPSSGRAIDEIIGALPVGAGVTRISARRIIMS